MRLEKQNYLSIVLFVVYMLLLISIILFKLPFYSAELSDGIRVINLIPLQGSFDGSGVFVFSEIRDNILIFIPFGIYLCLLKNEWRFVRKAFAVIVLSLTFEVLQFVFALGRTDVTDILSNSLGGIIGIAVYATLVKIFKSRTNKIVTAVGLIATIYVAARFAHLFYLNHFVMRQLPPR